MSVRNEKKYDLILQCSSRSAEILCKKAKMWIFISINPAFKWKLKEVYIFLDFFFTNRLERFVYNFFPYTKVLSPVDSIHYKSFLFFHFRSFSSSFAELIEFSSLFLYTFHPISVSNCAINLVYFVFTPVCIYKALIEGGKIHCGVPMYR